jgi:CYTH domain-containing protein
MGADGGHVEIERKYLLRAVPPLPPSAVRSVIEQGYLPGTVIIERLRRIVTGSTVRLLRTVKSGRGLVRVELEEECPDELFAALWPFTAGRRVLKDRYRVKDGALTWEVDVFTDRDLVLVEVELSTVEQSVEIPAWLAPFVIREVTDESGFVNAVLAR